MSESGLSKTGEIIVACVKWGAKYSPDYVFKLRSMVARHLHAPHRFVCLTEDTSGLDGIDCIPLSHPDELIRCWSKVSLFNPETFPAGATIIYLDLDVVIARPIDFILDDPGGFAIINAFSGADTYNSSVMRFEAGSQSHVYEDFLKDDYAPKRKGRFKGDQDWIHHCVKGAKFFPRAKIVSFKLDLDSRILKDKRGRAREQQDDFAVPLTDEAAIVVFHGKPDPVDVIDGAYGKFGHAPFVREHWR